MSIRGSVVLGAAVACLTFAIGCGDNHPERDLPYFKFDGRQTVGAMSLDSLDEHDDEPLLSKLQKAKDMNWVVMVYGHRPSELSSLQTIEEFMIRAEEDGLPFYTFADLAKDGDTERPGICLSFDDTEVDDWMTLRPLFEEYHARATFFVTRYYEFTEDQRAELHTLYDEGNSIEAHGINHVDAVDYVEQHGIEAYMADEVQPSIDVLKQDGFSPVAFAHPYGRHSEMIDDAISERVQLVRSISQTPLPGRDVH
jgi:hypothetical protein